tara:strand:- start:1106 stop:1654 length:549 start_codon:yes stop_codon:yes gene_type:complete
MTLGVDIQAVDEHTVAYTEPFPRVLYIGTPVDSRDRDARLYYEWWLAHGRSPKNASLPISKTDSIRVKRTAKTITSGMMVSLMYLNIDRHRLILGTQEYIFLAVAIDSNPKDLFSLILIVIGREYDISCPCYVLDVLQAVGLGHFNLPYIVNVHAYTHGLPPLVGNIGWLAATQPSPHSGAA